MKRWYCDMCGEACDRPVESQGAMRGSRIYRSTGKKEVVIGRSALSPVDLCRKCIAEIVLRGDNVTPP